MTAAAKRRAAPRRRAIRRCAAGSDAYPFRGAELIIGTRGASAGRLPARDHSEGPPGFIIQAPGIPSKRSLAVRPSRRHRSGRVPTLSSFHDTHPAAPRPSHQPDRCRRGRRASCGGAEGAARERARRGAHADRRRRRRRRHQAHPRRRQRRGHRAATTSRSRSRGTRRRSSRRRTISRRSPRSAFAARRWHRSPRCRGSRSRRARATRRMRGASRSTAATSAPPRPRRSPPARR